LAHDFFGLNEIPGALDQNSQAQDQCQDGRQARHDDYGSEDRPEPAPLEALAAARADFEVTAAGGAAVTAADLSRLPLGLAALRTNHLPGQYLGPTTGTPFHAVLVAAPGYTRQGVNQVLPDEDEHQRYQQEHPDQVYQALFGRIDALPADRLYGHEQNASSIQTRQWQ
jgi:hypothetical protein